MSDEPIPAITFLPWVALGEPLTIGNLRLLPYKRGASPSDLPFATQKDIDAILSPYLLRRKTPVREATMMEYGDWRTGTDASPFVKDLLRARDALTFAAITERGLFSGGFRYCNSHNYVICIQRYTLGDPYSFSFATRRRDGGTSQLWSTDSFAFQRPNHVGDAQVRVNEAFLAGLLNVPFEEVAFWEAIREFNEANTDSFDIQPHVEIVMVKSAFEWLFGIRHAVEDFIGALENVMAGFQAPNNPKSGPLADKWRQARPNAKRPLEAWAREFCDLRGAAAHGRRRRRDLPRHIWGIDAHMAFSSILFPLIVKAVMAERGLFHLGKEDQARLAMIDSYILHDPFAFYDRRDKHPWSAINFKASSVALREASLQIIKGTLDIES